MARLGKRGLPLLSVALPSPVAAEQGQVGARAGACAPCGMVPQHWL